MTTPAREADIVNKLTLARDFQMNDIRRSIFDTRTNFLTALGLVSYTEFWGHFMTGEGKGAAKASFDMFFKYLSSHYQSVLNREPMIYDELRCGLAHEYIPKNRPFTIYGENTLLSDDQIRKSIRRQYGIKIDSEQLEMINSRYYLDLKDAIDRFISEVPSRLLEVDSKVAKRFNEINFANFA